MKYNKAIEGTMFTSSCVRQAKAVLEFDTFKLESNNPIMTFSFGDTKCNTKPLLTYELQILDDICQSKLEPALIFMHPNGTVNVFILTEDGTQVLISSEEDKYVNYTRGDGYEDMVLKNIDELSLCYTPIIIDKSSEVRTLNINIA